MKRKNKISTLLFLIPMIFIYKLHAQDPLPSWNEGKTKQSIITFIKAISTKGSPDFVPLEEYNEPQK